MVLYLVGAYRVSERRACQVVLLPRATHRYQSIRDPLTELRLRMRQLAQTRIRYGYRKIRVLLIREGWQVGKKLVYRLYREEGLGLRMRPKRRRTVSEHGRQKPRAEGVSQGYTDGSDCSSSWTCGNDARKTGARLYVLQDGRNSVT